MLQSCIFEKKQMKHLIVLFLSVWLQKTLLSQTAEYKPGTVYPVDKNTYESLPFYIDQSGIFTCNEHTGAKVKGSVVANVRLVRFSDDKLIYERLYTSELKDKYFVRFVGHRNFILMISSFYDEKKDISYVYGTKINKENGEPIGGTLELIQSKTDDGFADIGFEYTPDSSKLVVILTIANASSHKINFAEINESGVISHSGVIVRTDVNVKSYKLENIIYTNDQRIISFGLDYNVIENGKLTSKTFSGMSIAQFDPQGKKEMDYIPVGTSNRLHTAKPLYKNGVFYIAGLIGNSGAEYRSLDSVTVFKLDIAKQEFSRIVSVRIDQSKINKEELRKNGKPMNQPLDIEYRLRKFYMPDPSSFLVISEQYAFYSVTRSGPNYYASYAYFVSRNITTVKIDQNEGLKWITTVPKSQEEVRQASSLRVSDGLKRNMFSLGSLPARSSFSSMIQGENLVLFFQDDKKNLPVTDLSIFPERNWVDDPASCFMLTQNLKTGAIKREILFADEGKFISQIRHGLIFNNALFFVSLNPAEKKGTTIKISQIALK
jgi:hypothetical protein